MDVSTVNSRHPVSVALPPGLSSLLNPSNPTEVVDTWRHLNAIATGQRPLNYSWAKCRMG